MFTDRRAAGHLLSERFISYRKSQTVVLGLARGGVEVARAIADDLNVPLDVLVVKKIPAPRNSELAIGAMAPDNIIVLDDTLVKRFQVGKSYIKEKITALRSFVSSTMAQYEHTKLPVSLEGKNLILTDDGIATGATVEAAIAWCRKKQAQSIILAVPVAPKEVITRIATQVDDCIVLINPREFRAVGQFYRNFTQLTDADVNRSLAKEPVRR